MTSIHKADRERREEKREGTQRSPQFYQQHNFSLLFDLSCHRIADCFNAPSFSYPSFLLLSLCHDAYHSLSLSALQCPRVPLQVSLGQLAFLSLAYFLFVLQLDFPNCFQRFLWLTVCSSSSASSSLAACPAVYGNFLALQRTRNGLKRDEKFCRQLLLLLQTVDRTLQMMCQKFE